MKPRITVPGIFHFSLSRIILSADPTEQIICCHSNTQHLVLGLSCNLLKVFSLPQLTPLCQYTSQNKPIKILQHGSYLFVLSENSVECLEWIQGQLTANCKLEGHMMPINDFILTEKGEVVTCSDDFTLRVWQDQEPFAIRKILPGHKSRVICLELHANCVISGSKAGEVAVWKDYKLFFMLQGLPPVEALLVCPQAKCLIVATNSPNIQVFSLQKFTKKQLPLLYKIPLDCPSPKRLHRLDDHFFCVSSPSSLSFIQVFLGQLILTSDTPISTVIPMNSLLLICDSHSLYLQDLSK